MALKSKFTFFSIFIRLIFVLLIFCTCSHTLAAESVMAESDVSLGPQRSRVFMLKFIPAQQGKQFLADVNITKVTQLNDSNTLLVTANQEDLLRASALLILIDSREQYVIKTLLPIEKADQMPSNNAIQTEIGGISIGTFFNLPGGTGYRAIIDTYPGSSDLIAIAPISVMDKIVAIAERVKKGSLEPNDNEFLTDENSAVTSLNPKQQPEADKLFNELLASIAEAAKFTEQNQPALKEPNVAISPELKKNEKIETEVNADLVLMDTNSPAVARNSYEPNSFPNADETLELALPEKLEIIQLLDLVGKYLNLNYVYDPKQLQGKEVYLKVQGPIKVRELYPLAESTLKFTGLAMSRRGNLVTIAPLENVLDLDPALIYAEGGSVEYGDVVVTRIFQLNYVDTAQAKAILEGMKLGAVTELPGLGTLIVTGYAYRMTRIEQLIEVIDKPGRPKQFKFRQLKYTMAKTLAPKVKELVEQIGDISIAVARTESTPEQVRGRPPRRPPTPQTPTTTESTKPSIYLDADERTNRILMIGQEDELVMVEDLIDALDVAQQDLRALRVYEIQHVDAEEVRRKLEELGIIGATRTTTTPGRITSRMVPQVAPPGQPAASPTPSGAGSETELPTEEMQVVVLESTNSLMVNASPEQHALVATIISYVDSESIQQAIPYVVYPLQNQPPGHIAEVLDKLIQEVVQDKEGKVEKVIKKTDEDIVIVPDPNTFSIIVYASKKNQDWIASLIRTLDRRRPQVLIDVTLVEVTNTDKFDLDLQLASKFPKMLPGGQMDVLDAVVGGAGNEGDTTFLDRSREAYSNPKAGVAQGFYSDSHIQALLTALESKNYGRVLAKPKILVNDGQVGIIKTTDTTNVKIETTIVPEEGNPQISTTYQPYEAGITLEIQPNISEGDLLLLIVKLDRSDFLARSDLTVPPDTRANTVDTIVTVPNEKTIILGGLVKLNQGKGGSKVPILGDIPLVGGLFRSTSNSVNDSKLYVFVKANILRPEEGVPGLPELERISDRNRAAFEKHENSFQTYQDWPGVKPKPVNPEHVLDTE